jgi:hypothetical protein
MALRVAPAAGGKLDYYEFLKKGRFSDIKRHLTIRIIGMKYRKLKSSSLQSLERGARPKWRTTTVTLLPKDSCTMYPHR